MASTGGVGPKRPVEFTKINIPEGGDDKVTTIFSKHGMPDSSGATTAEPTSAAQQAILAHFMSQVNPQ
ncbi:hypothetical protein SCG7086_BX_00100 [Chlamydiales bacterium SCGC AG-110-P3]|nr:hypothetical protein SCG7086_BX_00100 [Chlamydiales bacterium SCGC AG-110-P3]